MHATSAKAGPDLRCAPGWRRFASGFAEHRKIAETQRQTASRTSPHHIIGRCCANPIAAVVPAGHRQPHAFPIGRTQPPRLPPCEVFQRGPTQAQPPPSRRGPHRKTFTEADLRMPRPERQLCAAWRRMSAVEVRLATAFRRTLPGPRWRSRSRHMPALNSDGLEASVRARASSLATESTGSDRSRGSRRRVAPATSGRPPPRGH